MEHGGVNLQSIIRAALSLWSHDGEITQGGSTITQQVIKNNLLTQKQPYSRKLRLQVNSILDAQPKI